MHAVPVTGALLGMVAPLALAVPASAAQSWNETPLASLPPGIVSGQLDGVAATAPDDAWAVGTWKGNGTHPLTLHWDGAGWTNVPVNENAAPGRYRVSAVDSVAAGDAWAVGRIIAATSGGPDTALLVHYTGDAWHQLGPLPTGPVAGSLTGIDLVDGGEGWAVGRVVAGDGTSQPLVLRYRAGGWSVVPVPLPFSAQLTSVYAAPSGEAWAVGSRTRSDGGQDPLILRWDGAAWQPQPVPASAAGAEVSLDDVAGTSASDVWAVGSACLGGSAPASPCATLALRLVDGAWSTVPTAGGAELTGVVAQSPGTVWLVGYAVSESAFDADHVEQWDGRGLVPDDGPASIVKSHGELGSALTAAAADRAGGLWVVGWARHAGVPMPSVLRRAA